MTKKHSKKTTAIKAAQQLDFKLLIVIALAVALGGGFLVFTSSAMAKYARPINVDCGSYAVLRVGSYSVTCSRVSVPNAPHKKPIHYACKDSVHYKRSASGLVVTCTLR